MNFGMRKLLSCVLATTLLITCAISGIVLPTVAEEPTNLLTNGDLEQGASVAWGNSAYVQDGVGVGGSKGIKIETTVNEGGTAVWPGPYYKAAFNGILEPNTTYVFSFDYKHEGKGFAKFDITTGGSDWTGWVDVDLPAVADWTTHTIEFTTGAAENMGVHTGWEWAPAHIHYANAENYGTGAAYYDNFKLIKKPAAATAITLDKTAAEVEVGKTLTLTATATPDGVALPTITWTSADAAIATVENGIVTGVATGATTITATAEGLPPVTCTVTVKAAEPVSLAMPNGTFDAAESGWQYDTTVTGKFSKNDPVPVQTDAEGNKYIQIPADGAVIKSPLLECDLKSGDWVQVNFKVRKTAAGKMKFAMRLQGGMFTGYAQPEWIISGNDTRTSGDGEWFAYTVYAKTKTATKTFRISLLELANATTAGLTLDLDDVEVIPLDIKSDCELNLMYNGTMDAPSAELNAYVYDGLFNDGAKIEIDPDDATNNVLHLTSNAHSYFLPTYILTEAADSNTKLSTRYKKETVYKFSYRQKGSGTTTPAMTSTYATVLSTEGEPGKASAEWKTVTVYFKTTSSINANYTFDFKTAGDVYLDDMSLYEVESATAITLDQTTVEMEIGDTVTLTPTTTPVGTYAQTPVWTSDNTAVATVDNGVVTAVAAGNATITVTSGKLTATCVVTVGEPEPATSIELDKTTLALKVGDTATLTAATKPNGAPAEPIVWSVDNAAIVTVDNGVVTAVSSGKATVTVTSGTLTATCTVTVAAKAEALRIPSGNVEVVPNGSITLAVNAVPSNADIGTLTWASSDTAIATVDQSGKVTAVAASGTATITVSNDTGKSASVTVTINQYANILPNGDLELGANGIFHHLPGEGVSVEDGVGIDGSKALLLSKDYTRPITYFKGLNNNGVNANLQPNSRYILSLWTKGPSITLNFSKGSDITFVDAAHGWSTVASADEWKELRVTFDTGAAPSLDNNWSFYLKQESIGVEADTYVDNITLTKQPEAESITITPSEVELLPDDTATLTISSAPLNTSVGAVTWASSDESVIAVSQDGVITAVAASGTATITATTAKGLTATCTVTVNPYGNLLKNGDFEQLTANWGSDAKDSIKPGIGKDGSCGLELTNPTAGKDASTFYKLALSAFPATTYEISFDYLATPNAEFRIWSGNLRLNSPKTEKGDGTVWRHASTTFTTPADMNLNKGWDLSIVSDAEGDTPAVIDNVCLRVYSSGVEADSIVISKEEITMVAGRTESLGIMATPANGDTNQSVWTSSDENVATVEYGVVTAVGKGTATITAITKNGKTATCKVTVSGEKAPVINGTFDIENDDSWTLSGGAVLEAGKGRVNSAAAVLTNGASISQQVSGIQVEKTYLLSFRYRSTAGHIIAKLTNGEAVLVEKKTDALNHWAQATYEFTVPATLAAESSVLTLTTDGDGPIYLDNVFLAQKASLVDFVVKDIIWDGGEEQVITGTELLFAVTVANEGADPVPAGSVIEVDIATSGKTIRTLTYTCSTAMNPGDMVIVMDTEPWAATEGAHVVSARANPRLSILEMETVNNAYQTQLRVGNELLEAPSIAQQAGMDHLIFSDEFDSIDSIDVGATGAEYYKWYVTRQWSAPTVTRDAYDVKDGILSIHNPVPTYGITLTTVDVNTHNGFAWNKGYLEVRLCIPTPRDYFGGSVTVWSFPVDKWYETPGKNNKWVEMDWLEFWGNTETHPDGYWTVTLHDQEKNAETGEEIFWASNTNSTVDALGDKQWHTMGWLWDENLIQAYMDGVKMFEITYSEDDFPYPLPKVGTGVMHEGVFSGLNDQIMCLYLSGDVDVPLLVDYVHIWQGEGGGMTPDGGDDDEVITDMEAEDFWYNYCTDDWGDPIAAVTAENYQNILNGQEIWKQLSDERKVEINAYLESLGQSTYDELLAAALILADGGELPDTPDTGEGARALPIAVAVVALSAAALWATRKRRKV